MDRQTLKGRIARLMDGQKLAVLATHNDGHPYGSLMAFAVTEDLAYLLFVTPRATRKFTNIQQDPRAAAVIDSRSHSERDFHAAEALTCLGSVEEVPEAERDALLPLFTKRHEYLHDFAHSPSCAFIRMKVRSYSLVSRFQEVYEMDMP